MNKKELDQLLSKFYRGETTLDEEQQLRNALSDDSVDALLMQELENVDSDIEIPADLESNLSGMIDQWQDEEKQEVKVAPSWWRRTSWWAIAASVALVATVGLWSLRNHSQQTEVVIETPPPVIAKTTEVPPTPSVIDETQQAQKPEVSSQHRQHSEPRTKQQPKPSDVFKNKIGHIAQAESQAQPESSISDEELALAALEKFSTTLNKGIDQLNDASDKIDDINNTINQHLI